jgi:hypothetical protein
VAVVGCGAGWWCPDSPCGVGVSAGTCFGIYPFVLRSQYQWEAFLPVDMYVDVVHWLSLWGENQECVPACCVPGGVSCNEL